MGTWRSLPSSNRRWIVRNAVITTAVSNIVIGGAIAWAGALGTGHVPLWSNSPLRGPGLISDTIGTIILLPFFTCLIISNAIRGATRRGALSACGEVGLRAWFGWLPSVLWRRGLRLGLLAGAALIPPAIVLLVVCARGGLPRADFIVYKAVLGLALGLVVTPLLSVLAMTDVPARAPGLEATASADA